MSKAKTWSSTKISSSIPKPIPAPPSTKNPKNLIDIKKINHAFSLMRDTGLIAKQNHFCCTSCASADLSRQATQALVQGEKCLGFAYYHAQDDDLRKEGVDFCIGYGPAGHQYLRKSKAHESVGKIVCACLTAAGVPHSWNGDGAEKVFVRQELPRKRNPSPGAASPLEAVVVHVN